MKKYGYTSVNKYREMNLGRVEKALRIIKREGIIQFSYRFWHYFGRLIMRLSSPFVVTLAPKRYFFFKGNKLVYFYHQKSMTWANERAIEIPIIMRYIKKHESKNILEVGAVLPHYFPSIKKDTVDKFEQKKGVINDDILTYKPKKKYDLIVSISTLEHVGFDDDVKDPNGTLKAINCLRKMTVDDGEIIITLPIGYNKYVDELIQKNLFKFDEEYYYKRYFFNLWKQVSKKEAFKIKYGNFCASAIMVGIITSKDSAV